MQPLIPYYEVPVISLGPLDVHGFGIMVAVGFLVGAQAAMARARRVGLDPDVINRLLGWLIVGTFVGGHIGYGLMYKPDEYFADPIQFLYFWQGLSSFGGFAACVPITIWFFRKEKLPFWPYADSLAYGLAIGWFFGRMGCTLAHDHPGTATETFPLGIWCRPEEGHILEWPEFMRPEHGRMAPWGPCETDPTAFAAHDMGFYEAIWSLGMFGLIWVMDRVPRTPGLYVVLMGLIYGPVRFAMDFLRPEWTDARYLGFTPGQYWSVVFFTVCVFLLVYIFRKHKEPYWSLDGARARAEEEAETG